MGIRGAAMKRVVVVGDDPMLEMRMANDAGAVSIGMTTGLMTPDTIAALKPRDRPALLLDSLEPLHLLLIGDSPSNWGQSPISSSLDAFRLAPAARRGVAKVAGAEQSPQ